MVALLPKKVTIGPWVFTVMRDNAGLYKAEQDCTDGDAHIAAALIPDEGALILREEKEPAVWATDVGYANPTRDALAVDLMHEVLHGCFLVANAQLDKDGEERVVETLARTLIPVMRLNPELVAFIMEHDGQTPAQRP